MSKVNLKPCFSSKILKYSIGIYTTTCKGKGFKNNLHFTNRNLWSRQNKTPKTKYISKNIANHLLNR